MSTCKQKPSLLFPVHPSNRLSVSKLSDIATITNFSIPLPSSTRNQGIISSDDLGEALSVSSKDIHLSNHATISGIHCTLWPQCTNVTDRRTDRTTLNIVARDVYITSHAKKWDNQINMGTSLKESTDVIRSNLYLSPSSKPWALSHTAEPDTCTHTVSKSKSSHTVQHHSLHQVNCILNTTWMQITSKSPSNNQ